MSNPSHHDPEQVFEGNTVVERCDFYAAEANAPLLNVKEGDHVIGLGTSDVTVAEVVLACAKRGWNPAKVRLVNGAHLRHESAAS